MGNHISDGSPATGKVILPNGSIQEFNEPITVAELMLEHPQQAVIELKEAMMTQKREHPIPLPADVKLDVNRFYAMVPLKRGKPVSTQEAHLILLRASVVLSGSKTAVSSSKFLPLFARILPMGLGIEDTDPEIEVPKKGSLALEERTMEEFHDDDDDDHDDDGVEGLELIERADYLKRKASGKGWKPSLDPIEEKKYETNEVSNLVSLAIKVGKRFEHKGLVWG